MAVMSPGRFRLLLATIVVLAHFTKTAIGSAAVDLFFVLSGFWIYRMFNGKYARSAYPGATFLASRLLRLLPTFLLCNTMAIALHIGLNDEVARNASLYDVLPNILIIGYSSMHDLPLGSAWSLDIELQFYLVLPLLIFLLKHIRKYLLLAVIVALALGGVYISFYLKHDGAQTFLPYTGFFLYGIYAAQTRWIPSKKLVNASFWTFLLALGVLAAMPGLRGYLMHSVNDDQFVWNKALNFAIAVGLAPVALSTVQIKSTKTDRLIGDLSYVVYCFHWIAVIIAARFLTTMSRLDKAPIVVALVLSTYVLSYLILVYFDAPVSQWRERWVANRLRPLPGG